MAIFYPNNPERQARVIQLVTQSQTYLGQEQTSYASYTSLLNSVNASIAAVYQSANLPVPPTGTYNILSGITADAGAGTVLQVAQDLLNIGLFFKLSGYFTPAALKGLVRSGLMSEETAAARLITVLGRAITWGELASTIAGGILAGVAIEGVNLIIDAIEGAAQKDSLVTAIDQAFPIRAYLFYCQQIASQLVIGLTAVQASMSSATALAKSLNVPITQSFIQSLITESVQPSINSANAITMASINTALVALDQSNSAYTEDDPAAPATFNPDFGNQ